MRQLRGCARRDTIPDMKPCVLSLVAVAFSLSGCGMVERLAKPAAPVAETALPAPIVSAPLGVGQSAAALDATTAAEKAAAVAAPQTAGARELGRAVVGLGSPAEQGFWLKSALVAAPGKGRVVTGDGKSVAVDLIPGSGGALLSLAAFRALGLELTDLPEVTVFAN